MEQVIIDVVLGLVLIYITLSLLAMKVQEMLAGSLLKRRVGNLHNLLYEAAGQDANLKGKLLENPLIFALFKGESAQKNRFWPSKGPSEIPPALFARALLMELNGGRHPSEQFAMPSDFLNTRESDKNPPQALKTLRALAAGRETSWPDLETALAGWYDDIGVRSKGWFQRESQAWALLIALLLAGLLNVDSFYIAQRLSADPDLRSGLADLAESVHTQSQTAASNAAGSTPATRTNPVLIDQAALVSARMADAITRLNDAFNADKDIALFRFRESDASKKCKNVLDHVPAPEAKAAAGQTKPHDATSPNNKSALSDSVVWLRVLPSLRSMIDIAEFACTFDDGAVTCKEGNATSAKTKLRLQEAYVCLSYVSAWVTSAITASADLAVRSRVQEAAVALEASKSGLLAMIERQAPTLSLKQLFHADPKAFEECASGSEVSRRGVQECLARVRVKQLRLPIGFGQENTRQQFCEPVVNCQRVDLVEPATLRKEWHDRWCRVPAAALTAWYDPCKGNDFPGNATLDIPPLSLQVRAGAGLEWLLGVIVTSFFVALGAPFWFDVLGKVVNLRSAGRAREEAENTARGQGSAPVAPLARPALAEHSEVAPFSQSRNRFEEQLVVSDIVRLQQQLGAQATAQLDRQTRSKIADYCKENGLEVTDQLSLMLFDRIVGRNPVNVSLVRPSARMLRGQVHEQAAPLASALMEQLDFPGRIATSETRFTDDLRALAVLYRYKKEKAEKPAGEAGDLVTTSLAKDNPAVLNELDEALTAEIINYDGAKPRFAREEQAPWLDWAIGELGQVEKNRSTRGESNPRICEYLDVAVANSGNNGDQTPWCGAFAAWVLNKQMATMTDESAKARLQPPEQPLAAANWRNWGTARARADARPGDVVVVKFKDGGHHVGFLLKAESGALQLLGGNQNNGTTVCLSRFTNELTLVIRGVI